LASRGVLGKDLRESVHGEAALKVFGWKVL
jgi:hypothetical protein